MAPLWGYSRYCWSAPPHSQPLHAGCPRFPNFDLYHSGKSLLYMIAQSQPRHGGGNQAFQGLKANPRSIQEFRGVARTTYLLGRNSGALRAPRNSHKTQGSHEHTECQSETEQHRGPRSGLRWSPHSAQNTTAFCWGHARSASGGDLNSDSWSPPQPC